MSHAPDSDASDEATRRARMAEADRPASGTHESGYAREGTMSPAQERAEDAMVAAGATPPRAAPDERPMARYLVHPSARSEEASAKRHPFFFRRGPMETVATILIAAGFLMLFQPFAITLYTYSFITLLVGTVMFMVVSKFPEA